jgi:hypothetical protein
MFIMTMANQTYSVLPTATMRRNNTCGTKHKSAHVCANESSRTDPFPFVGAWVANERVAARVRALERRMPAIANRVFQEYQKRGKRARAWTEVWQTRQTSADSGPPR